MLTESSLSSIITYLIILFLAIFLELYLFPSFLIDVSNLDVAIHQNLILDLLEIYLRLFYILGIIGAFIYLIIRKKIVIKETEIIIIYYFVIIRIFRKTVKKDEGVVYLYNKHNQKETVFKKDKNYSIVFEDLTGKHVLRTGLIDFQAKEYLRTLKKIGLRMDESIVQILGPDAIIDYGPFEEEDLTLRDDDPIFKNL